MPWATYRSRVRSEPSGGRWSCRATLAPRGRLTRPASGASRPARTRQRGLALAVAPDDRQAVAGVHAEAHAVEHVVGAEGHAHLDRLHRRLGQRGCQRKPLHDGEGVVAVVDEARAEGIAALDLEFMGAHLRPVACLAQVATPRGVHLIDPIEGAPLLPVAELVADPAVEVVARALGRPDAARPRAAAGAAARRPGHGRLRRPRRGTGARDPPPAGAGGAARQGRALHRLDAAAPVCRPAGVRGRRRPPPPAPPRGAPAAPRRSAAPSGSPRSTSGRYGPDARLVPDPETAWQREGPGPAQRPRPRRARVPGGLARRRRGGGTSRPRGSCPTDAGGDRAPQARRPPRPGVGAGPAGPHPASAADGLLAAVRAGAHAEPVGAPAPIPGPAAAPRGARAARRRAGRRPAAAVDLAPSLLATRDEIAAFLVAAIRETWTASRSPRAGGGRSPATRWSSWRTGASPWRPPAARPTSPSCRGTARRGHR